MLLAEPAMVAARIFSGVSVGANCQTLVSLTLARREVPVPLALRLYLPEVWTEDPARLAKAGVPEPAQRHRSKSEIALAELDRVLGAEVRFGVGAVINASGDTITLIGVSVASLAADDFLI
jgi:SRSO17 transposase